MPAPLLSRHEVVQRLAAVFRHHGYGGASLKLLSDATGLGRSSLYHYFPRGKEDMARAVLGDAAQWVEQHVLTELDGKGTPEERVTRASEALCAFYDGGKRSCLLELFSAGDAREPFGEEIAGALRHLQRKLSSIAQEVGVPDHEANRRAEDAVIALQGALVLARGLGDGTPFRRVLNELPRRLLAIG